MRISFNGETFTSYQGLLDYLISHPDLAQTAIDAFGKNSQIAGLWNTYMAGQNYLAGNGSINEVYGSVGSNQSFIPETEKYLDNLIGRENTANDQQFQEHMRDTSLTSSGAQLNALGLSPSSVISVGGASSGVSSAAASQNMHSTAALAQQRRINDYNNKMGLAKTLIQAAGSMASSGIYGAAIGAVKHSAQQVAGAAAHSGLNALKSMESVRSWKDLPADFGAGNNSIIRDDGSLASWAK